MLNEYITVTAQQTSTFKMWYFHSVPKASPVSTKHVVLSIQLWSVNDNAGWSYLLNSSRGFLNYEVSFKVFRAWCVHLHFLLFPFCSSGSTRLSGRDRPNMNGGHVSIPLYMIIITFKKIGSFPFEARVVFFLLRRIEKQMLLFI